METTRGERIRLGLFIAITLALIAGTAIFLVGKQLTEKKSTYHTRFTESVDGLNLGAKVKLNGIEVGQVTRIVVDSLDLHVVVVWFDVVEGTPIKKGMMANMVGGMSLTGLKTIELTGGAPTEADVEPSGLVPAGTSSLKQLTGQAETLALKTEMIMNNLLTMTSEENLAHFAGILRELYSMSRRMDSLLVGNTESLNSIGPKAVQLLDKANSTLDEMQKAKLGEKTAHSLANFDKTMSNVDQTVTALQLEKTMQGVRSAVQAVETLAKRSDQTVYRNQEDLSIAVRHMREAMENLNDVSRQVRENPSLLLRGEDKQERSRR